MRLVHPVRFTLIIVVLISTIVALVCVMTSNNTETRTIIAAAPVAQHVVQPIAQSTTHVVHEHVPTPIPTVVHSTPMPVPNTKTVVKPVKTSVSRHTSTTSKYDKDDLYLLAKLIHCEAGIDNYAGKLAVGTVVMNRTIHTNKMMYGSGSISSVVYHKVGNSKRYQFSCVGSKKLWAEEPNNIDIKAARKVLDGYRSFGKDVLYYYNPTLCNGIDGVTCSIAIGMHVFGKE